MKLECTIKTCTAKCVLINGFYALWYFKTSRKIIVITKSPITYIFKFIW